MQSHLLSNRIFAIMQVSETPDAAGAQLLRGTLSDTSEAIRYMAARSLGEFTTLPSSVASALLMTSQRDSNEAVRAVASESIRRIQSEN